MSVVIETLVICDGCDDACGGDDRDRTAKEIRASRKSYGWVQRGKKDYCDECVAKGVATPEENQDKNPG